MIVHSEDGDEVAESPIFPRTEFIPGLGSINSFTHDPKRAELILKFWYDKVIFILYPAIENSTAEILCTIF
jgi:hypothetical protein